MLFFKFKFPDVHFFCGKTYEVYGRYMAVAILCSHLTLPHNLPSLHPILSRCTQIWFPWPHRLALLSSHGYEILLCWEHPLIRGGTRDPPQPNVPAATHQFPGYIPQCNNNNLLSGCGHSQSAFVSSEKKGMERILNQLSFQVFQGITVPRKVHLNLTLYCALPPCICYQPSLGKT